MSTCLQLPVPGYLLLLRCRGGGRGAAGGEDEDGVGLARGLEVAAEDGEVGEVVALRGGGARVRGDGGRRWAVERG